MRHKCTVTTFKATFQPNKTRARDKLPYFALSPKSSFYKTQQEPFPFQTVLCRSHAIGLMGNQFFCWRHFRKCTHTLQPYSASDCAWVQESKEMSRLFWGLPHPPTPRRDPAVKCNAKSPPVTAAPVSNGYDGCFAGQKYDLKLAYDSFRERLFLESQLSRYSAARALDPEQCHGRCTTATPPLRERARERRTLFAQRYNKPQSICHL